MSICRDKRAWDYYGSTNPYWGVCTLPEYRSEVDPDRFFASGEAEVEATFRALDELGVEVQPGHALDFGCGVGRLTRALAARFAFVTGVDVSTSMVDEARRANDHLTNCHFIVHDTPDITALGRGSYDFVLSFIALQHVSSASDLRRYVRGLAELVGAEGILVMQLPGKVPWRVRAHPSRLIASVSSPRLLSRFERIEHRAMALRGLAPEQVNELLREGGLNVLFETEDRRSGSEAIPSFAYVARR